MTAARLRFKIFTSFAIAVLGGITFVRLLLSVPLNVESFFPFVICGIFIVAGIWRGVLYLGAVRSLAKS